MRSDHRLALLLMLRQRLSALVDALPSAQSGDSSSVHQARVATRRLRAALPVLQSSMHARQLARARDEVRTMTRALGPVRELDVSLQHLEEIGPLLGASPRALARLKRTLVTERMARRRQMRRVITPESIEQLHARLHRVGSGPLAPWSRSALNEADRRVRVRAARMAAAIHHAGGLYLADRLHAVRVAAKKLRYAMEIDRELKRSRSTARITQLKRLQDVLGDMHDFEMLIECARRVQLPLRARQRTLAAELGALVQALETECRNHHAAYLRTRPSMLRLCDLLAVPETAHPAVA